MNLASWIILLLFVAAFALAVRHVARHGACSECGKGGCDGNCTHCRGRCPAAQAAEILMSRRSISHPREKT